MFLKIVAENIKKIFLILSKFTYLSKTYIAELLNIIKKRKLYKKVQLSKSEEKEIKDFWIENYGKNISTKWHRLYQSYTGKFQPKYFPEIIFSTQLELKLNDRKIASVLSDKSLLEILFKDIKNVKIPQSFLINNSGVYYSPEREILTKESAISHISNIGEVIMKTTLDASSGDAVKLYNFSSGTDSKTGKEITNIFDEFERDFTVQEKIIPNRKFRKIYPFSINTLRIVTYIFEDEIYHAPLSFRIGQGGNFVDNIHAGGIVVGLNDDGILKQFGFTEMQKKFTFHPDTDIVFKGYQLPKTKEIINVAKKMHKLTPHMKMISWDFTVNENDEIVLLEMNLLGQSVWFPQMVNGESMFGDNTARMLEKIK